MKNIQLSFRESALEGLPDNQRCLHLVSQSPHPSLQRGSTMQCSKGKSALSNTSNHESIFDRDIKSISLTNSARVRYSGRIEEGKLIGTTPWHLNPVMGVVASTRDSHVEHRSLVPHRSSSALWNYGFRSSFSNFVQSSAQRAINHAAPFITSSSEKSACCNFPGLCVQRDPVYGWCPSGTRRTGTHQSTSAWMTVS